MHYSTKFGLLWDHQKHPRKLSVQKVAKWSCIERTCFLWILSAWLWSRCVQHVPNLIWDGLVLKGHKMDARLSSTNHSFPGTEELRHLCAIKSLNVAKPAKAFTPSLAYCILITWDKLMERGDAFCSSYKRIRQLKIKPAPHGDDQGIPFPPGGQGRDTGS